ncbi:MaoC family dehydratase (plasmid) [Herbiconiux sp. KACC 21604]|uniref:MaoC family dehydratase n=1 Tax=unclassified Herbiconiux TaxID=2618217 RepID=UPI0014908D18|nr:MULTISPECIES: MaoC family dehydratase [unclassified Herbiconiux]QJU56302.1 MaoC family dehydratase [Herbiconiux sp. SALV-R1]WPO88808.1 MaoC family dehydratase [Herbiconiux sp. KACC 21604]
MTARTFESIVDLAAAIGAELGPTPWHSIDQHRIDTFAETTEDRQWIHVEPERAAAGPFGGTIAHGYLTLSLVSVLLAESFEVVDAPATVNYGLDRVRFPAPVAAGSRIRGRTHLLDLKEVAHGRLLVSRITVEIDGGTKPACVADVLTLFPTWTEIPS